MGADPAPRQQRRNGPARHGGAGDRDGRPRTAARRRVGAFFERDALDEAQAASSRRLTVGAPADFLLLRLDSYEIGLGDLAADLVYAADGSVVDTTVVAGRVLMRDGEVEGAKEIVAQAAERARRLGIGWAARRPRVTWAAQAAERPAEAASSSATRGS